MPSQITNSVQEAAAFLLKGKVVALPSETVFGLGALINQPAAIAEIFRLKNRPADNPLIVHIADTEQLKDLTEEISDQAEILIKALWPGPITFVFKKNSKLIDSISCGLQTVAVRMPCHPVFKELLRTCKIPIVAPSANISGRPSATKAKHVVKDFGNKLECILDGEVTFGLESTVVDCTELPFTILRQGAVTEETLLKLLPTEALKTADKKHHSEKPKSPGTKYKHYSPKATVKLLQFEDKNSRNAQLNPSQSAYIGLTASAEHIPKTSFAKILLCKTQEEYASELFAFFRECDELELKTIYCQEPSNQGIGKALLERLQKASAK